jgi:hypothetical protein
MKNQKTKRVETIMDELESRMERSFDDDMWMESYKSFPDYFEDKHLLEFDLCAEPSDRAFARLESSSALLATAAANIREVLEQKAAGEMKGKDQHESL